MTQQAQAEALANLRHLYQQMVNGAVKDSTQAKRIAEGLLSRAIAQLEAQLATFATEVATLPHELATQQAAVQLPGPVAFALEWTFNGEERGMRLYDDETHCRFDAESDGGVCSPLYTEQQVRAMLSTPPAQERKPLGPYGVQKLIIKLNSEHVENWNHGDLVRAAEIHHGIGTTNAD